MTIWYIADNQVQIELQTTDILGQKSTELSVVLHFSVSFYSADT